jgi:hypothetical protein
MKERERVVVTGVLGILVFAWLGFLVHRSPRFPGSGLGSAFGIAGAALMLVPLAYPLIKRIPVLNARITRRVSMKSLLLVHIYTGILGPVLAVIHTGHKFDSLLGISLTAVMLLVVVNGFSVRYLLAYVGHEITDKLLLLQTARGDLDHAWGVLERSAPASSSLPKPAGPKADVTRIAESVADLEYAIRTHELFKRWFRRSLTLHIVLSVAFYLLLALHIGSGNYFGLRWMR